MDELLVMFDRERKTLLSTYDEGVQICLGPFTCEISLGSSFRIGYIFGQERR